MGEIREGRAVLAGDGQARVGVWRRCLGRRGSTRLVLAWGLAVLGLVSTSVGATVVFDNYRGQDSVPAPLATPNYDNYATSSAVQLQNLIDFAAGGAGNIQSSGSDTNINWNAASNTLCNSANGSGWENLTSCVNRVTGRVVYALVKFPTAGTYAFSAAHDDEVKVEFSSTFSSANAANYRSFDYNVPVGQLGAWTANDTTYETIPGNFVVPQAGMCYVMRVYWNNQGGINHLRLRWTPPSGTAAIIPAANLRDPSLAASYSDCASLGTDLAIYKGGPANFQSSTAFNYTITLWNKGPNATSNATFADTLPSSLTVNSFTCTAPETTTPNIITSNTGNAWAVTMGGTLAVNSSTATPPTSGARLVCTVNVTPNSTALSIANTATITVSDSDSSNNTSSVTSTRNNIVSVTKSAPATAIVGQSFNYQLTVSNNSGATRNGVVVLDQLPPNVMATAASVSTGGVTCAPLNTAGALLTCTMNTGTPNFTTGTSRVITLAAVSSALGSTTNYAATDPNGSGGSPSSNPGPLCSTTTTSCASANTTFDGQPNLVLAKAASPTSVAYNGNFSYALSIANSGPVASAAGTVVVDAVPAGVNITSLSAGSGWTCTPSSASGPASITCTKAAGVAAGVSSETVVTLNATKTNTSNVTNSASISSGDPVCASAPATARCNASALVTDNSQPNLVLAKAASVEYAVLGSSFTYTLQATNSGPVASADPTTIVDTLPAGVRVTAIDAGPGFICTPSAALPMQGDGNSTTISCVSTAGVAADTTAPVTVATIHVLKTGASNVTNSAHITTGDPMCPAETRCEASVTVINAAGLGETPIPTLREWVLMVLSLMLAALAWTEQRRAQRSRRRS